MPTIDSETKPIGECSARERDACYHLLCEAFEGVTRPDFERDFSEKECVFLLRSAGKVVGFSTVVTLSLCVDGAPIRAVFSGDTTVRPEYRSSQGLGIELGRYFTREMRHGQLAYYVLISKGWRTYKVLPFFFHDFYPRHDAQTPAIVDAVIGAFAEAKYPRQFDPKTGVISFNPGAQRLRPGSVDSMPRVLDDHVCYFLQANPGYLKGDELVCVAALRHENFTRAARRMMDR